MIQQIISPFLSSNCRIRGILTQFAAATAQKGTNLPIKGGACLTKELSPKAVAKAPPVAATYDVPVKEYLDNKVIRYMQSQKCLIIRPRIMKILI